jgi:hypothetical protein
VLTETVKFEVEDILGSPNRGHPREPKPRTSSGAQTEP